MNPCVTGFLSAVLLFPLATWLLLRANWEAATLTAGASILLVCKTPIDQHNATGMIDSLDGRELSSNGALRQGWRTAFDGDGASAFQNILLKLIWCP